MPAFAQPEDLLFGFGEVALIVVDGLFIGIAFLCHGSNPCEAATRKNTRN